MGRVFYGILVGVLRSHGRTHACTPGGVMNPPKSATSEDSLTSLSPLAWTPGRTAIDKPPDEPWMDLYRKMARLRSFEAAMDTLDPGGRVPRSFGSEAMVAGITAALQPGDVIVASCHPYALALAAGYDLSVIAELMVTGDARNATTASISPSQVCVRQTTAPSGSSPEFAQSLATLASAVSEGRSWLTWAHAIVVVVRDDAIGSEEFLETLGIAIEWSLPMVFVCENNQFVPPTTVRTLYEQARTFDLPSDEVDGMNPMAVASVLRRAIADARSCPGPRAIEMLTFYPPARTPRTRFNRQPPGVTRWRDPITQFREAIVSRNLAEVGDLLEIHLCEETEVTRATVSALQHAQASTLRLAATHEGTDLIPLHSARWVICPRLPYPSQRRGRP